MISPTKDQLNIRHSRLSLARVWHLNLFKQKHGDYPEKLDEVSPEFIDVVPDDPFTGKALVYRRDGAGYILYSLGPNRLDNNGTLRASRAEEDYDIVWKIER